MRLPNPHRALLAAVLAMTLLPCGIALAAPSAVGLHDPDLPAAATVWCLENSGSFAASARAVGLDIGTRDDNEKFDRPGGREISLPEWSVSPDPDDIEDFDAACGPAFEAFGPSGGSGDGGTSLEEDVFIALLGVGVGAIATGSTSLGLERWRSHRKDADELRRLSGELREAVAAYVPASSGSADLDRARAAALALRDALDQWRPEAKKRVEEAESLFVEILDSSDAPRIGDLGEDRAQGGKDLMGKVSEIRTLTGKVAKRVGSLLR